jgi:hypothetical protein
VVQADVCGTSHVGSIPTGHPIVYWEVAQLAEQWILVPPVLGSIPSLPRKVKILERAETMGDGPTRSRTALGRRYAPILDRVTLCYVRFGCFPWDSAFSPQP